MGILKGLALAIFAIFGLAMSVILMWGILYLTIPPIKEFTDDKIFNMTQEAEPDIAPQATARIENGSNFITIDFNAKTILMEA